MPQNRNRWHKPRKKILFFFFDGVGIGKKDPFVNPFFAFPQPAFDRLFHGFIPHAHSAHFSSRDAILRPINATLLTPGLPQSGTGQASLLTGVNTARLLGRHFGPYLYSTLRPIVEDKNIFKRLTRQGIRPLYINAFPDRYFTYITGRPARIGAIAYAWKHSGFALNTAEELRAGLALSADFTAERWRQLGHPGITPISPYEAGRRMTSFLGSHDFVLFEYYFTDQAGHHQSFEEAHKVLANVNDFILGILDAMDANNTLLIITSDHGNIEDLSTKSHTRNPVPLIAAGAGHSRLLHCRSLTDLAPFIINYDF